MVAAMRIEAIACVLLSGLAGCTSFWNQRDYQKVTWSDGDDARIEVWLRQGSMFLSVPWLTLGDILITPVMWIGEVDFALAAMARDDARIEGGPMGFVVSLLPCFTCVPLDAKPSVWLPLSEALQLGPEDRAQLTGLGEVAGIEWLVARYEQQFPENEGLAERARYWVSGVSLAAPAPKNQAP